MEKNDQRKRRKTTGVKHAVRRDDVRRLEIDVHLVRGLMRTRRAYARERDARATLRSLLYQKSTRINPRRARGVNPSPTSPAPSCPRALRPSSPPARPPRRS